MPATPVPTDAATARWIEEIVARVVARLRESGADPPPAPAKPSALVLTSRLLTLDSLQGRLDGIREVVVPRGAVVTPAVRDELRRRSIALAFATKSAPTPFLPARPAPAPFAGLTATSLVASGQSRALLRIAAEETQAVGGTFEAIAASDLPQALVRLSSAIAAQRLGLLLADRAAIALCAANRSAAIRAVAAGEVEATLAAMREIGANLLIVDPARRGLYDLQRLLRGFVRGGVRPAPQELAP